MLRSGRSFASDNNATAHPEVMDAITRANRGHVVAYGSDPYTEAALRKFREHFGEGSEAFFVFNGTAANVLGLQSITRPHQGVICAESAHIETSECGAAERFTGCKLIDIPTPDGKLTPELIASRIRGRGDVHSVQPAAVSIAQITECGTLYTLAEVRAIADLAHSSGLCLHMDGARLSNAAAALGVTLRQASRDLGVDVLSFGGTKNGLICGESVVLFDRPERETGDFIYVRKQGMQLASKMRFISAQFEALLTGDLWLRNARHANAMARRLLEELRAFPTVVISQPLEANMLFVRLPEAVAKALQSKAFFYILDEYPDSRGAVECRWICSFDTTEADIREFLGLLGQIFSATP